MSTKRNPESRQQREAHVTESEMDTKLPTPRKPTFTENVIMTIKILAGFGFIGAALWAVNLWVAPK
jgi:hypothetical protein